MDKDGYLSFSEFNNMVSVTLDELTESKVKQTFDSLDTDWDGYLTLEDLKRIFINESEIDEEFLLQIFNEVDLDKDGLISYDEFKQNLLIYRNNDS